MAEEIVDAIVLSARLDDTGLEQQARDLVEGVNAAVRSARSGKPVEIADTESLRVQAREFENIAQKSLLAVRALERLNVSEAKIAAALAENGLLTRDQANALLELGQNAQVALASLTKLSAVPPPTAGGGGGGSSPIPPIAVRQVSDLAAAMAEVASQSTPMTRALTSVAAESAAAVTQISSMTAAMSQVAGASTVMTRAMTSAAAESQAFVTEVTAMAQAMSEVAAASNPMTRAMASAAAESQVAATKVHAMAQAMSDVAAESNPMTRAMASAAAQTGAVGNAAAGVGSKTRGLSQQLGLVAKGSDTTQAGVARLRSGLAQLAVISVETSSPVGQVAQGLLFAAGATSTFIIAIAGAIAAYQKLTKASRDAREEQEALIKAQRQRLTTAGPGDAGIRAAVLADQTRLRDLTREISDRTKAITQDAIAGIPTILEELALRKRIAEVRRIELALQADQADLEQQHRDEIQATLDRMRDQQRVQAAVFSDLGGQLAILKTGDTIGADAASRKQAIAATEGLTEAQRTAAISLSDLIEKLQRSAKAHEEAEKLAHDQAVFLDQLTEATQKAADASVDFANKWGDQTFKEIVAGADAGKKAVEDFAQATQSAIDSLLTAEEIHQEFIDNQRESFKVVTDSIARLNQVAGGLGLISQSASDAVASTLDLADALNEVALTGLSFGNIMGVVSSALGVVGSISHTLFHGDDEQKQILKDNTAKLEDLSGALDRFKGASGILEIGKFADIGKRLSEGGRGIIGLEMSLNEAGITLDAFARIVREQTGIEILDKKGRVVAGSMEQLRKATELAAAATLKFGTDIQSRQDFLTNQDRIFGDPNRTPDQLKTASLERARDLQLQALHLSDAEEAWIRSLDLGTEAGRAAFKREEQSIADRARKGQLTRDELGDFKDVGELFGNVADTMDILNESAKDAADSLKSITDLNLPQGFKLSQLAFQTSPFGPSRPNDGAQQPLPITPPSLLTPPAHRGTDVNPSVSVASVTINVSGADKPEETAAAIDKHLRSIGMRQSGDTLQMGLR